MVRGNNQHIDTANPEPWSLSNPESDFEVWNRHPDSKSNQSAMGGVPDPLRPGVVPVTSTTSVQDDVNPWGDLDGGGAEQHSNRKPLADNVDQVPQSLQPGVARKETNPFKKKPVPSRAQAPQDVPASLSVPSRPPAATTPPSSAFAQMQLNEPESNSNPWQPAIDDPASLNHAPRPHPQTNLDQESANNIWGSGPTTAEPTRSNTPAAMSIQRTGDSAPWGEEMLPKSSLPPMPAKSTIEQSELSNGQHAWDDVTSGNKGKQPVTAYPPDGENWNLIDHEPMPQREPVPLSRQSSWENFMDADDDAPAEKPPQSQSPPKPQIAAESETSPSIPPDQSSAPPALPPRTNTASQAPSSRPAPKSDTYQIKNINWYDAKVKKTRKSPILVQNVNGPCPLVALVNALTLTTPHSATSNLVETLRSREQVSIDFLLEAIIDELMSSGRRDTDAVLPDMTELYQFLKGLQTGMNVNPRFLPSPEAVKQYKRTSLGHVHPSERDSTVPGTFEDTKDMILYATFSIPLMHGWLPPSDDPVHDAFSRQTASYDDVQNLLFREEELEVKLSTSAEGLTEAEQQLYQDIFTIKAWLSSTATQLTPWGLEVVNKSIQPGGVAILFRNDHFATLYRHPQTLELLTLVTDAGYFKHDEVIWESLVDVRGEKSDFYSGDFRVVGGSHQQESQGTGSDQGGEWQTVQGRRNNSRQNGAEASTQQLSQHEQEDRDLALALQLQEEEEERHRSEQARRRRQSELSEQYIEQQGRPPQPPRPGQNVGPRNSNGPINIPVRGSGPTAGSTNIRGVRPVQQVRSLIPPRTHRPADGGDDDAPPTYEQASQAAPYRPPAGHPSHEGSASSTPRRMSEMPNSGMAGPGPSNGAGRGRYPSAVPVGGQATKDEKCAVM